MKLKKLIKHYSGMMDAINAGFITEEDALTEEGFLETVKICKSTLKALKDLQEHREGKDNCDSCEYANRTENEKPCKNCKRAYTDKWEWGGKDE